MHNEIAVVKHYPARGFPLNMVGRNPRLTQLLLCLVRKGTDKLPGFKEAWERLTTSF